MGVSSMLLLLFLVAAVLAAASTPLVYRLSRSTTAPSRSTSKPPSRLGGLAIGAAFLAPLVALAIVTPAPFESAGLASVRWLGLGLCALAIVALGAKQHPQRVEYAGMYWHLVDIVWIFLFPLLYLAS